MKTSCRLETILGKDLVNDNTRANGKLGGDLILTCWWIWLLWLTQINFLWTLLLSLRLSWSFLPIQVDQPSKADWKPLFQSFICIWLRVISIICAAGFGSELLPTFPSLNRNQGLYESGKGKLTFIEHLLCAMLFHDYSIYDVGISHEE